MASHERILVVENLELPLEDGLRVVGRLGCHEFCYLCLQARALRLESLALGREFGIPSHQCFGIVAIGHPLEGNTTERIAPRRASAARATTVRFDFPLKHMCILQIDVALS